MILASASPRRKELLEAAGLQVNIAPADIDETRLEAESPRDLVLRLASEKAAAVYALQGRLIRGQSLLAADTVVWTKDDILGKPTGADDARRMLHELSGRTHWVSSGVCIRVGTGGDAYVESAFVETTAVTFKSLTDDEIEAYLKTDEPYDKAGAYGIQGLAGAFVDTLDGDYDNVVGLPVQRALGELTALKEKAAASAAGYDLGETTDATGSQGAATTQDSYGSAPLSITQIPGIYAAHSTNEAAGTGCTVIVCPAGAVGGVDVRGGAPATRETDLLRPEETVGVLHAVVLSGGSAYGLAASIGVAEELERAEIGLDVGVAKVPIVSGACLFDLAVGDPHTRPTVQDGAMATHMALLESEVAVPMRDPLARGNVGAGTGCTVGKVMGPARTMKAGLGESVQTAGALVCGAIAAVNACGDVVDPTSGSPVAGVLNEDRTAVGSSEDELLSLAATMPLNIEHARTNTTVSCVVTNARLTKAEATKVAQMAADAYAHAIHPTHTTNDGDTVFVMATGEVSAQADIVGILATRALEEAIVDGARQATSAYGFLSARDL